MTTDLAWAVGLFEGEGCVAALPNERIRLIVTNTDRDTLERFEGVVHCGHIIPQTEREGWKSQWQWVLYTQDEVTMLLDDMWPLLGERRRARALELGYRR